MKQPPLADADGMSESPTQLFRANLVDVVTVASAHGPVLHVDLMVEGEKWRFSAANAVWLSKAGDPVTPDQLRMHFLRDIAIVSVFEGSGRVELWSKDGLVASFRGDDSRLTRDPNQGAIGDGFK